LLHGAKIDIVELQNSSFERLLQARQKINPALLQDRILSIKVWYLYIKRVLFPSGALVGLP
jgi:hypothetical protein